MTAAWFRRKDGEVLYGKKMRVSDFEVQLIRAFRATLERGYGDLTVKVRTNRLVACEQTDTRERIDVSPFAEAMKTDA